MRLFRMQPDPFGRFNGRFQALDWPRVGLQVGSTPDRQPRRLCRSGGLGWQQEPPDLERADDLRPVSGGELREGRA